MRWSNQNGRSYTLSWDRTLSRPRASGLYSPRPSTQHPALANHNTIHIRKALAGTHPPLLSSFPSSNTTTATESLQPAIESLITPASQTTRVSLRSPPRRSPAKLSSPIVNKHVSLSTASPTYLVSIGPDLTYYSTRRDTSSDPRIPLSASPCPQLRLTHTRSSSKQRYDQTIHRHGSYQFQYQL